MPAWHDHGRTCGNILTKNYMRSGKYGGNVWIRVHKDGVNLSSPGDSGSPWYKGNAGYGIHSAGVVDDATYMAINYIDFLDLTLVTSSN